MALIPRYQQRVGNLVGGLADADPFPPDHSARVAQAFIGLAGTVASAFDRKPRDGDKGAQADAEGARVDEYVQETEKVLAMRPLGLDGQPIDAAEGIVAAVAAPMTGGLALDYDTAMASRIRASGQPERTFADFKVDAGLATLASIETGALEKARQDVAGDPTGFARSQTDGFRDRIGAFLKDQPEEVRTRWAAPARRLEGALSDHAYRIESELKTSFQARTIKDATEAMKADVARDPALFADRLQRGLSVINASILPVEDRERQAGDWKAMATLAYGEGLARVDPKAALALLQGDRRKTDPSAGGQADGLSTLPETERTRLIGLARRSEQAMAARQGQQDLGARLSWRRQFEAGLKAGALGQADIAAAVSAGQLSGPAEVRAATELARDHARRQASLVSFAQAAANPKHGWNSADADQRQAIDDVFEAGERTPADVEDLWRLTGVLPTRAAARLRGDLDSADPARVAAAASLLTAMRQARPEDYASHDDAQRFTAAEAIFNHRIEQYGDTPEAAAQAVIALRDPIAGIVDNAAAAVRGMNGSAASILSASERLMAATIRSIRLTAPPAEQDRLIHDAGARLGQVVLARYDKASGKDFLAGIPATEPLEPVWRDMRRRPASPPPPTTPNWALPKSDLAYFDRAEIKPTIDKIIEGAEARGLDVSTVITLLWVENAKADPRARNGSYVGLFQLGPKEWASKGGTSANRLDEEAQIRIGLDFIADRQAYLSKPGYKRGPRLDHEPAPWEVYLAHQQGDHGAVQLINADPNALAAEVLSRASKTSLSDAARRIRGNLGEMYLYGVPGEKITVDQYRNYWIQSFAEKQRQVRERYGRQSNASPPEGWRLPPSGSPFEGLGPRLWPHLFPPLFKPVS